MKNSTFHEFFKTKSSFGLETPVPSHYVIALHRTSSLSDFALINRRLLLNTDNEKSKFTRMHMN